MAEKLEKPEKIVKQTLQKRALIWIDGQWKIEDNQYSWVSGHWETKKIGYIFINGEWDKTSKVWVWKEGYWKKIDINVIDKFGPDGLSQLIKYFSLKAVKFQSGYIYHYAFVMLIGFSILLTLLLVN